MSKIFVGPDGIRSGWRLLMFFVLLEILKVGLINVVIRIPRLGPEYAALLQGAQFDPVGILLTEVILVASLFTALRVMTAVERRRIGDYGWRAQLPRATRRWVIGFLLGAAMVTAMYTLQWLEQVYSFGTWALPPSRALIGGTLWFVGCFLIGVFEEGVFRGYAQFTLEKSIGFWAAVHHFGRLWICSPARPQLHLARCHRSTSFRSVVRLLLVANRRPVVGDGHSFRRGFLRVFHLCTVP
jgi:CAAX protease family protein